MIPPGRLRHRPEPVRRLVACLAVALGALAALLAPARAAGAQDVTCGPGDQEVRRVVFDGNEAFSDADLETKIVTTPSTFASRLRVLGTRRCLDPIEFARDLLRLQAYYRKRGYPDAAVDTVVRPLADAVIEARFIIREGTPLRLDSVAVAGLERVPERARVLRDFPLRPGGVFDQVLLEAWSDSIERRLRNAGYPRAVALREFDISRLTRSAQAQINVLPGQRARFGAIEVRIDTLGSGKPQRIPDATVRRLLGFRGGQLYSARALFDAQRNLAQTDAYRSVDVRPDSAQPPGDSVVNVVVALAEGSMYAARVAAGWATLDCFRAQGELTDRDFMPWAQRLELNARVSKIGIGRPLGGTPALCPQASGDPYSLYLNYYTGVTLRQPVLFGSSILPSLSIYTSRASEYKAFLRSTPIGGLLTLSSAQTPRFPRSVSYQLELGRTNAEAAIFCALFNACDEPTRRFLESNRRLAAAGVTIGRDRRDDRLNPRRGNYVRAEARHASPWIGSDRTQQFNKIVGDGTWFFPVGEMLLIGHVQGGAVFSLRGRPVGEVADFIPPQERLYAGGPTTVRGFRQNELGPVVYVVDTFTVVPVRGDTVRYHADAVSTARRTVPIGGNSLVVGNLELQFPSPFVPDLLQLAAFVDAGEVWNRDAQAQGLQFRTLKWTPGAGIRILSPFGAIRVDVGYNRYSQEAGAAYYIGRGGANGEGGAVLFCVSPGNELAVAPSGTDGAAPPPPRQGSGTCPATYRPERELGFWRRLNLNVWIGQAF